jgi:hypothetical protein
MEPVMTADRLRPRAVAALLGAAATVLICATVMFSSMAGPAGAATPTVSLAPSTGAVPGAQVGFTVTGFPGNVPVLVDECDLGVSPSRCVPITGSLLFTAPDGTLQGTATVVDCAAGPCAVTVGAEGAAGPEAEAPLTFSGGAPATPVTVPSGHPAPPVTAPPTQPAVAAPARVVPVATTLVPPAPAVDAVATHTVKARSTGLWALGLAGAVSVAGILGAARARARLRGARAA